MLQELGIVKGNDTAVGKLFEELFPNFMEIQYDTPSAYMQMQWDIYWRNPQKNASTSGNMFEYLLASLCIREGILPFYMSTKIAFVPNVEFDIMFYAADNVPICWSAKTSLRERYKQADLEAMALKNVHRRSLCYLLTLNGEEAGSVKKKIERGDVMGLDDVIVVTTPAFDILIQEMKNYQLIEPPTVEILTSKKVITREKVKSVLSD